jgi:hypothetical protein
MVESPAETAPFGCQILRDNVRPGPASHDGTGIRFVLLVPEGTIGSYALDVERRDLPQSEAVATALGPEYLQRWGEIEVMAKLLDLPAHLVMQEVQAGNGSRLRQRHGIDIQRQDTGEHWIVIGRRQAR